MKRLMIVLTMILIMANLVCCNNVSKEEKLAISTWEKVVDKEFSNFDFWAGTGLYFYEEDDVKYCVYMIYGSGVPVIFHYKSEVEINEGTFTVSLPISTVQGNLNENLNEDEIVQISLTIEDQVVQLGDVKYSLIEGVNFYDTLKAE